MDSGEIAVKINGYLERTSISSLYFQVDIGEYDEKLMKSWANTRMLNLLYSFLFNRSIVPRCLVCRALLLSVVVASTSVPGMTQAGDSPIADDASVYFIWPKDGAVMKNGKFRLLFGLRNCGIAPAGVEMNNTGHHHLIINAELPAFDEEIPADRNYIHFGKGQTETVVDLPSGTHTLQLLFADHNHVPHQTAVYSDQITITVP